MAKGGGEAGPGGSWTVDRGGGGEGGEKKTRRGRSHSAWRCTYVTKRRSTSRRNPQRGG